MAAPHSIETLSDEQFGWYFTGLTDGEGSFGLHPDKRRNTWSAVFVICLRADDAPNLEAVARRIGCGNLTLQTAVFLKGKLQHPQRRWYVSRAADLARRIIPHFERFPLQLKKRRDFEVWRKAIPLMESIAERSTKGLPRGTRIISEDERAFLAALAAQLKSGRQYDESASPIVTPHSPRLRGQRNLFDGLD